MKDTALIKDLKMAIGDKLSCFWTVVDISIDDLLLKDS